MEEKLLIISLDNTFDPSMKKDYSYLLNKCVIPYGVNEDGNYLIKDPLYPYHQWTIHYADVITISTVKES